MSFPSAAPLVANMTAWAFDVADDLFDESVGSANLAASALEHLRVRAHAAATAVWVVSAGRLQLAHAAGEPAFAQPDVMIEGLDAMRTIERLRQTGTIVSRPGEVSGLEELVPDGMHSFIVAGAISRGIVRGALVVAWKEPVPQCDERAVGQVQIAAPLLVRSIAIPARSGERRRFHDAIVASLADRIAVVDRDGIILEVNAAWTEFGRRNALGSVNAIGPGVNYLDICRRAAADGSLDAAAALDGIQSVCSGSSALFETVYACNSPDQARWCAMTVTPLQHRNGGAVIVHTDITRRKVAELARHEGDMRFHCVSDAVPIPMWTMSADGTVVFGNERWMHAFQGALSREWTNAFHPEDRARAMSALDRAVRRGLGFSVEVRLKASDSAYRWALCLVHPQSTPRGEIESYVGCCCDVSAKRRVEAAFNRIASKLVAAQEAERSRIARDLHDDLGQRVALLASRLQGALSARRQSADQLRKGVAEARKDLQELAVTIHNLSHELHPAKIRLLGLVQTLEALCRDIVEESGLNVRFTAEGMLSHVDEDTALCVFRVAQEALRNAVKHSGARTFDVHLSGTATALTLRIADDGDGFDPLASQSAGIGLVTMRERVELMGGVLTVETALARGTMIEIWVPVIHAPADAASGRATSARAPVRARGRATRLASSSRGSG